MRNNRQAMELVLAARYGAVPVPDRARGKGWYRFELRGRTIWYCSRGWAIAKLVDNHYIPYSYISKLEDALKIAARAGS